MQHRMATGMFNANSGLRIPVCHPVKSQALGNGHDLVIFLSFMSLFIYVYLVCMLLAMAVDIAISPLKNKNHTVHNLSFHGIYYYRGYSGYFRDLLNSSVLILLTLLFKCRFSVVSSYVNCFGIVSCKSLKKLKTNFIGKFAFHMSYWLTILNLILIVISNPCIINPGPSKDFLSFIKM